MPSVAVGERARRHFDVGHRRCAAARPRGIRQGSRSRSSCSSALARASPRCSINATLRSSSQRRVAASSRRSSARTSTSGIAPGAVRTVISTRTSTDAVKLTLNSDDGAGERLHQQLLPLLAQVGAVAVARRVDQAGDEALEAVAVDEQPEALPFAEAQDAHDDVEQLRPRRAAAARRADSCRGC